MSFKTEDCKNFLVAEYPDTKFNDWTRTRKYKTANGIARDFKNKQTGATVTVYERVGLFLDEEKYKSGIATAVTRSGTTIPNAHEWGFQVAIDPDGDKTNNEEWFYEFAPTDKNRWGNFDVEDFEKFEIEIHKLGFYGEAEFTFSSKLPPAKGIELLKSHGFICFNDDKNYEPSDDDFILYK
jgi:hypothetical protein